MVELLFFIFGTVVGSFLNLCISRLPKDLSIIYPKSHCPACGHNIRWFDNIPILSYILLKGRCRDCGVHIPLRYIIVETVTGSLFLYLYFLFGLKPVLFIWLFFFSVLILISFIDIETFLVPDSVVYPAILVGIALSLLIWNPIEHIAGLILGGGIIFLLVKISPIFLKKSGMGEGDIGISALIGIFLGWRLLLSSLIISSVLGIVLGGGILWIKRQWGSYIPYGPYLSAGALISFVFKDKIELLLGG
jgi:leader peptidase (prepilin peptidase)/N-methyltransferase